MLVPFALLLLFLLSSSPGWAGLTYPGESWIAYDDAGDIDTRRFAGNIGYTEGTYARPREYWISIRRSF